MAPRSPALPPGPEVGPFTQALALHREPLGTLRRLQARYGPRFTLRLPTARPVVVVCDPADARAIAAADPEGSHAGAARRWVLPQASPVSSFGGDGGTHRAAKARLVPAFSPEATAARAPRIADLAREHVASWPRGRPFRLLPRARLLADEVTARLVLGIDDPQRARAFAAQVRRMLFTPGNPPVSPMGATDGLLGAAFAPLAQRRLATVRDRLLDELQERRRRGDRPGDPPDLLGLVADLPDDQAVDEVMPVLMAAQEPMAAALTWVLLHLAHHPELTERHLADPAFAEQVTKEALRLTPPALAMLRRLTRPFEGLPAGTTTLNPIVLLHRHAPSFPDPDAFRPHRWDDAGAAGALHVPFGEGERRCLGEPLALAQLREVVPAVLRERRVRPVGPHLERMVLRATILVPQRSGLVVAT